MTGPTFATSTLTPPAALADAATPVDAGPPAGSSIAEVVALIASVTRRRVTADDLDVAFADLGVDSLALAELAAELEMAFGLTIDDKQFARLGCLRDAVAHVDALRRETPV